MIAVFNIEVNIIEYSWIQYWNWNLNVSFFLYFIIHYIHKCKGEGKVHEYATYL